MVLWVLIEMRFGGGSLRGSLGLLRPLRGSGFALGQPDAYGAGESSPFKTPLPRALAGG